MANDGQSSLTRAKLPRRAVATAEPVLADLCPKAWVRPLEARLPCTNESQLSSPWCQVEEQHRRNCSSASLAADVRFAIQVRLLSETTDRLQEPAGKVHYLSRHGRRAAFGTAVVLPSRRAALLCLALWSPRLRIRWGADVEFAVERLDEVGIWAHTDWQGAAVFLARARSKQFAANCRVLPSSVRAAEVELTRLCDCQAYR